ncbi:LexA repressor [Pelotomaculum sp. FP]|uniref:LexA family protein n=1 Tax=Pelotomaculum sp. FP TaxID=261474 RepID=UPI001064BC34|nr:transcriptional regulator [Pelotomaculum sp. FP]TEB15190.1 LexA repressor [Pelotomaculum sp. FP]
MNIRENQIYSAILNYTTAKGYPPSVRELGTLVGLKSSSTVHLYLHRIKLAGYIDFEPNQARTLRVVK